MKKFISFLAFLAVVSVAFTSCKDDDDDDKAGPVVIDLTNVAGTQNVDETGATSYTNSTGEQFTINKLKYYISNVQLLKGTDVAYTMPESYFLVDESNQASTKCTIPNVPPDTYTGVRFMLGVDSTRNVSGSQTGALDQGNDMFWTWNSGYIFYKLEGTSPAAPGGIVYHIGGFRDGNNTNAIRNITINFGAKNLVVDGTKEAEIHLLADVLKIFNGGPHVVSIADVSFQMAPGGNALKIADNYAQMFTLDHLHNE